MHTLPADAMDVEQQTSTHSVRFADDVEVAGQQHREPLADASSSSTSRLMARRFSSPATSTPVSSAPAAFPSSPSREEERDFIINAVAERLRPNQTCFIISMGWWNAWKAYAGVDAVASYTSSSDLLSSPRPGPINNLVLCHDKDCPSLMELCALRVLEMQKRGQVSIAENTEEATAVTRPPQLNVDVLEFLANFDKTLMRRALCRAREMKAGLIEGKDCVAVPAPAWKALHAWYGGGPIIPRPVIGVGVRQRLQVELYPVTLLVLPLNSGRSSDRETYRFTFSPLDHIKTVRRAICGRFLHPPHKVELFWHLSSADAEHLSDLELTLGQMGLQDGSLVSLQRAMHADPLGLAAAPTAAPQALPPQQPQQLPQNDGRPLASLAQPL